MIEISKKVFNKLKNPTKYQILAFAAVFLFGFVSYGIARLVFIDRHQTHYHANFALYVNGQRDEFKNFTFYEEVTACSDAHHSNPKSRVHMHSNINNVIHVHDDGVTWAHFFNNLGYVFADGLLRTNKDLFTENETAKFTYILNGNVIKNISDKTINSEDVLLINYGSESPEVIKERYNGLSHSAHEYNEKSDPNTCSGGQAESFMDRLKRTQLQ